MAALASSALVLGEKAEAKWKCGHKWFNVIVDVVNEDGTYSLTYEDGDKWDKVPPSKIRQMDGTLLDPNQANEESNNKNGDNKTKLTSGKWEILRKAILSSKADAVSKNAEEASIHRHDGYHMFHKVIETIVPTGCEGPDADTMEQGYHVVCYQIQNDNSLETNKDNLESISLRILERKVGAKLSLSEIAPGKHGHGEGVDNTGNVRVWPAEEILLHVVLGGLNRSLSQLSGTHNPGTSSSFPSLFSNDFISEGNKRVLELGGGMTSLAGLGLAVSKFKVGRPLPSERADASSIENETCLFNEIVLTDGNPSSVSKQKANLLLNQHLLGSSISMSSHVLFWEPNDENGTEAAMLKDFTFHKESNTCCSSQSTDGTVKFDLIMGADLLFFESHGALACCLDRLLTQDGMVLLCQPSRGGTMESFTENTQVQSRFDVTVYDARSFDPIVASLHERYSSDPNYDTSIHSPSLICLKRKRR